jgi:hypothetical protein
MNRFDMFNAGDLITVADSCWDEFGIVVGIGKHRQVHVYWPSSQKITKSGKNGPKLISKLSLRTMSSEGR